MGLEKTLTLQDLIFFGIASILGSGGFNLIGEAVVKGGSWWPAALSISSVAFMGASRVYEEAFNAFKSNTAESDFVKKAFGDIGSNITIGSVFTWNILSISTILVLCAHMLFPEGTWIGQISFAIFLLLGMATFSLRGLDVNKETINLFSALLIIGLSLLTFVGIIGVGKKGGIPGVPVVGEQSFVMSILFFYFILAGFDALIKFTEETKDPKDVPRSFYISNAISIVLTLGICLAFVTWVNIKKLDTFENGVGEILQSLLGGNTSFYTMIFAVMYMIITTFVAFLATTRYIYSLAEHSSLKHLTILNEKKAPINTIWLTTLLSSIGILVNHAEYLVRLSDFGLSTLLVTVSAAATKLALEEGKVPLIEGATTAAFTALMGISFMK